jgi:hypothetical protein
MNGGFSRTEGAGSRFPGLRGTPNHGHNQSASLAQRVALYLDPYWRMAERVNGDQTAILICESNQWFEFA